MRSVFVIDPASKVRLSLTYPKSVGRNFDEILRAVDALQVTDSGPFSTPADWQDGERVIVAPTVSTADARERFGERRGGQALPALRHRPGLSQVGHPPLRSRGGWRLHAGVGLARLEHGLAPGVGLAGDP